MIGIYKIVNNINGKFYVGQSNDIDRRFVEHCSPSRYKQSNIPVDWAIHKYGKENFSLIILQECSIEELNELETYWIDKTNAIEEGYNCNRGGDCASRGEWNPRAKLSVSDVMFIRKCYNDRLITQKEAYETVKDKVSFGTFQTVWQGKTWSEIMPEVYTEDNKNYYKKMAGIKAHSKLTEEQIMSARKKYAVGAQAKELYENYKEIITYEAFQKMLCGMSNKHLPYFHKKTNKWIFPGEQPKKNTNRVNNNSGRYTTNAYSNKEVLEFRKQYVSQNYKEVYENSDKRLSRESFQKMLSGRTYTNVPIYSKKTHEWIYK